MSYFYRVRQVRWRRLVGAVLLGVMPLVLVLSLTACGKRPGKIDPPPDVEDDRFPQAYPDPATDPKP